MGSTSIETNVIHTGDCFDVLPELPDESVHAAVADGPYGLAFMGRDWDDFDPKEYQDWCEQWATEVKRVLKPGGHLLAFSGNRTHHRLFTGVEDAGFEIRDTLTWHYGSGFPKASDISKTIDKRHWSEWLAAHPRVKDHLNSLGVSERQELEDQIKRHADAEREVVGPKSYPSMGEYKSGSRSKNSHEVHDGGINDPTKEDIRVETEPATDAAKKWDGFKTGLKPSTEFVVMARKPFDGATVDCVLEHGTGALNIEVCRIGEDVDTSRPAGDMGETQDKYGHYEGNQTNGTDTGGRYPSNLIFDEVAAGQLDAEVGDKKSCDPHTLTDKGERNVYSNDAENTRHVGYDDSGGPSRYFYTSKATKAERTLNGRIDNAHPTVKPPDLMEWLVKLVTAEDQIVLDPFCGSGTTCRAAKDLNRRFIGIERQAKWADVARVRTGLTPDDPSVVRDDDSQNGLEQYAD